MLGLRSVLKFGSRMADQANFSTGDNNPGRASITRKMNQDQAREAARALARAERDKLEHVRSLKREGRHRVEDR
jgi:hypothetical protein